MTVLPTVDVLVIGLGAAGGVAASSLARAGLTVVGLEAGPALTNADFITGLDELAGWQMRNELGKPKFNGELPTWRPNSSSALAEPPVSWLMMNAVGGGTIHYGAMSWRYSPGDFRVRSNTIARIGADRLPRDSAVADWPIDYDELERYYDRIEYEIGVSGSAGTNPFEGRRSRAYPMPPLRQSGYAKLAATAMHSMGYHPFPQPAAINSTQYDGRPGCSYCGFCFGFGCWNNSKSSTLVTSIRHAEASGHLEVRPLCSVTKILLDESGRARGAEYRQASGQIVEQPARFVILAGYVYENTRRLLLSRSNRFPNGLSNNRGQVGKYFIAHTYLTVSGLFPGRKINAYNGTVAQATVMDDFNGDNFDHSKVNFIRGGVISALTENRPIGSIGLLPGDVPKWGPDFKRWIVENLGSVGCVNAQIETLAYHGNFLDLDPQKKDKFGDPVVRITYDIRENEKNMAAFLQPKLEGILRSMGASKTWLTMPPIAVPVNSHAFGGTRMGADPESSVVDQFCISHEVPNLAILGGSTFPTIAGYNPTQTIQAVSLRSAEYIAKHFGTLTARSSNKG